MAAYAQGPGLLWVEAVMWLVWQLMLDLFQKDLAQEWAIGQVRHKCHGHWFVGWVLYKWR